MSTTADALYEDEFLTHRQRRTPILLPTDPDDEELALNWTLSGADKKIAARCRGNAQRRRFAVQLCVLGAHGRFLAPTDTVPVRILNHLSCQLELAPVTRGSLGTRTSSPAAPAPRQRGSQESWGSADHAVVEPD